MQRFLIIHRLAKAEARKAYRWYRKRSKRVALRFETEIDAAIGRILQNPEQYAVHLHHTRTCKVRRFPYLLVYQFTRDEIQIISVPHGKKKPGYWRKRLI